MKTETILFDTITPHPNPVQLADLLTEIEAVIKNHVILNDHAAAALAVWVLHTYTFELRDTVAYVAIESPEKRCGKTTLLSVLAAMACKPLIASNITVGALFRAIHNCSPTLFADEADTFLAGNSIMRGIINSGNTRRTAYVLRLSASRHNSRSTTRPSLPEPIQSSDVSRHRETIPSLPANPSPAGAGDASGRDSAGRRPGESIRGNTGCCGEGELSLAEARGSNHDSQPSTINPQLPESADSGLKKYSCWCPKVISMIGEAPDTIADRSIVVKMARKLTTETCAPLSALNTTEIRAKCARFALDAHDSIKHCPKISGEGLNDRAADTFDPLYVIARHAGDEWLKKLHAAALALSSTADSEKSGAGLILDILDIFADTCREKIFTRDLVPFLRDGGLKSQALKSGEINEYQVSKTLRQYGIKPDSIRIGKEVKQGYLASDFRDALKRYVSQADIEARIQKAGHRWQLMAEAQKEADKQEALFQKFKAAVPRGTILTESEKMQLFLKLKKEQEMADTATPLVEQTR